MTKMWREIFEQPTVLRRCLTDNDQLLQTIANALKDSDINNVVIAARGTSDHAGIYGKYIIEHNLGIPVALAAPSIFTMYGQSMTFKNSLVIGISQSGKAEDVLEVIRCAKSKGAMTIGITNFADSPIGTTAQYHLYTNAGLEESVAATKTFTSQMMMLAILVAFWSDDQIMLKQLEDVPDQLNKVLGLGDFITQKVQRYRYMEDCFVLSRGINYAIALESALKIQETTYVRAKGYAISDFHHGPFAMIEDSTPTLVYAPQGPSLNDAKEMIDKLENVGAEIVLISNDADLLDRIPTAFRIPDSTNDMITPFYNVVFAQMFACQLALSKGLNPDAPRGLNKVTITR